MEHCSRQCFRRGFFAVLIGISPIVICLLFIALARTILHFMELIYNRRHEPFDRRRRRFSSQFNHTARPTLSYTPVSWVELQRIIQGDYHSQRPSESSSSAQNPTQDSPKSPHFMKSILHRHESSPPVSTRTLANLVVRRDALNSTPYTALLAPVSTSACPPTLDVINEQIPCRPSVRTVTHKSVETMTLSTMNNNNDNNNNNQQQSVFFNTSDSWEPEPTECDPLVSPPKTLMTTTTTTTVVVEEFLDFHSVHSVPYSLNLGNITVEEAV